MRNFIIGTCGHVDHGKTALIHALNGFEGDSTKEEQQRGITIDLSFSNMQNKERNIAFIDVPGHEKLVKNMIAGAFSFDCVLVVVSAVEGIMPQTIEHLDILNLLGVKSAVVVLTKKDLVSQEALLKQQKKVMEFLSSYDFSIHDMIPVSIYDDSSILALKSSLFALHTPGKEEQNFFRYYVDRVFSSRGTGTIVTGTVLGKPIAINEKVYICDSNKETKIKNIQVHDRDVEQASISNRTAMNLARVDAKEIKRGFVISKKGYLRGFNSINISFKALKGKKLFHNREYSIYIGSKKIEAKVLLFNALDAQEEGFATIKSDVLMYAMYDEKLIIRHGNETIVGGTVLNPINDPMRKSQKLALLKALHADDFTLAYEILLQAHKKGLGLISSAQRFALSHEVALEHAKALKHCFVDEKALVIYPMSAQALLYNEIKATYTKNPFAFLSVSSIAIRHKWASEAFISLALNRLLEEKFLLQEGNLYRNAEQKDDFKNRLENIVLTRLKEESISPTAPYNIYDQLDVDRKLGDSILKKLCASKQVIRLQHNLFVEATSLHQLIDGMKKLIEEVGYIDLDVFKTKYPLSRKYLIAYLDYLDYFDEIEKQGNKRVFKYM